MLGTHRHSCGDNADTPRPDMFPPDQVVGYSWDRQTSRNCTRFTVLLTTTDTRYSPAKGIGYEMKEVSGRTDPKYVSTSFMESQNWSVRTSMRRYTRLSNGFTRKLENHAATTALNYFAHNFIKIHRTLRTSPAMATGATDRLWSVEDLVALWEGYEQRRAERAA
jgi:hypothetical protein